MQRPRPYGLRPFALNRIGDRMNRMGQDYRMNRMGQDEQDYRMNRMAGFGWRGQCIEGRAWPSPRRDSPN